MLSSLLSFLNTFSWTRQRELWVKSFVATQFQKARKGRVPITVKIAAGANRLGYYKQWYAW